MTEAGTLRLKAIAVAIVLACCLGAATACGSGQSSPASSPAASSPAGTPTTSSPSPTSVVCSDVAALRASLTKLTHIQITKGAASELAAAVGDVQSKLSKLAQDTKGQWNTQINAVKSALDKLQTAVTDLGNGSGSITAVVSALREVATTTGTLLTTIGTGCQSSSPSS